MVRLCANNKWKLVASSLWYLAGTVCWWEETEIPIRLTSSAVIDKWGQHRQLPQTLSQQTHFTFYRIHFLSPWHTLVDITYPFPFLLAPELIYDFYQRNNSSPSPNHGLLALPVDPTLPEYLAWIPPLERH